MNGLGIFLVIMVVMVLFLAGGCCWCPVAHLSGAESFSA